jgi:aldehyde dehydrogenase (NAD+)
MSLLASLGLADECSGAFADAWLPSPSGPRLASTNPATGETLAHVRCASEADYDRVVDAAVRAFHAWRKVPAPKRGLAVRAIGDALRDKKAALAALVSAETGKIAAEAEGEVQEMIDVADFALGLSRQLDGLTMPSERAEHRIMEQWHPLGVVGCITAFNFPVAVWAWNALIGAVCGDAVVWKPSE